MSFSTFFSKLQESPWYYDFLSPIINSIDNDSTLLDIGTGSGKMLQLLFEKKQVTGVGVDTSASMLEEAKKKLQNTKFLLKQIDAGKDYPFKNNSFDYVTICSVLFNLKNQKSVDQILSEALRVLKKGGKIIILTPTGKGNIFKLTKHYFSIKNKSIYIWYNATKRNGKTWTKEMYLSKYSAKNNLTYKQKEVLNGFAQIETIIK